MHALRVRQDCVAIQSSPYAASATSYLPIYQDPHVSRIPQTGTILRVRSNRSRRYQMGLSFHRTSKYSYMQLFLLFFFIAMINISKIDENKKSGRIKKKISLASFREAKNSLK